MRRFAVVIVNYNSGEYLGRCLDALETQTRLPECAVVVDNDSRDDSPNAMIGRPSWMRLLPLALNTGFAVANNIALSFLDEFDYVALLNPDTIPANDWFERLTSAVDRHGETDFYGCQMRGYGNDAAVDGTGDVYHVSGLYWRRDHGKPLAEVCDEESEIIAPCAAAALYHRKSVMDVGGFDEDYFCYSEDVDLGLRLRGRGCRAWYINSAIVSHVGSGITGKHSDFSLYHGHRNLVWTFFKNMPGIWLWVYLPQHLLMNFFTLIYFTLKGRGRILLKAKWDALKGLPGLLPKRRVIGYLRIVESRELLRTMRRGWTTPYLKRYG